MGLRSRRGLFGVGHLEEALFLNLRWACVKGGSGVQFEAKGFMHLRGVLLAHTGLEGLESL